MDKYEGAVFKYYNADRKNFFDDLMVRFTQTVDLNDPLECLPKFEYFCDNDVRTHRAIEVFERNYPNCNSPSKRKQFIRTFLREFNWKKEIKKTYKKHLDILGIFSLTDSQFNEHLWTNYARDGFCIEFDHQSDFFSMRSGDVPGTGELYRVSYSDEPIIFDAKKFFQQEAGNYIQLKVFYQKTNKWYPESEVHIIRFRCLADKTSNNGQVSLFQIPNDAIRAVYFSPRAHDTLINEIQNKMKQTIPSVPIYKITDIANKNFSEI